MPIHRLKHDGRLVMLGDHKQLPPTYKKCRELELSLFERLIIQKGIQPLILNTQYRMHKSLINFSSKFF